MGKRERKRQRHAESARARRAPLIRPAHPEERRTCVELENLVWPVYHYSADGYVGLPYQPGLHVVAVSGEEIVATGDGCPFNWDGDPATLPPGGWQEVVASARERVEAAKLRGPEAEAARAQAPDAGAFPPPGTPGAEYACALGISIKPSWREHGLGLRMLEALRSAAFEAGYRGLVAPVRPVDRWRMLHLELDEYVNVRLADGRSFDRWLRLHEAAGGRVIGLCQTSLVIGAETERWEGWTGLRLPESGSVLIEGANGYLTVESGYAALVEESVWILHEPPS